MGKEWANWPAGRPADDPPNQQGELALGREQVEPAAAPGNGLAAALCEPDEARPRRRPAIHFHG